MLESTPHFQNSDIFSVNNVLRRIVQPRPHFWKVISADTNGIINKDPKIISTVENFPIVIFFFPIMDLNLGNWLRLLSFISRLILAAIIKDSRGIIQKFSRKCQKFTEKAFPTRGNLENQIHGELQIASFNSVLATFAY